MYSIAILVIFILTCTLPIIVAILHKRFLHTLEIHKSPSWLLILAAVLFVASFYLPNVHISDQTSTFQQHFVGGGVYVACLFIYFKQLLGWQLHWVVTLAALFAWASAFGVANELLEFALVQLNLSNINTGDTSWDLAANTLGAFAGYGVLRVSAWLYEK